MLLNQLCDIFCEHDNVDTTVKLASRVCDAFTAVEQ